MRASHIHTNLAELSTFGPELAAQMRARISAETLATVGDASTVAWLPVEHDIEISRAVRDVVGVAGLRKWSLDAMARSAQGPLLRPLLDGTCKLFGVTPHALFRMLPRGYGLVYRDCGENTYEPTGDRSGVVTMTGVPPMFFADDYLEGTAGAFQAFAQIVQWQGSVHLKLVPKEQQAIFEASWARPAQ